MGTELIGPIPITQMGNKYFVTNVDYFSKRPEAGPIVDKTALSELSCRSVHRLIHYMVSLGLTCMDVRVCNLPCIMKIDFSEH